MPERGERAGGASHGQRGGEPGPPGERDPRCAGTARSRARRRSCRAARGRRCFPGPWESPLSRSPRSSHRSWGAAATAHPMPGRKVIRPPPVIRFCSAARAVLFASCVTGFRLAARQGECTSTPPRWEEIWCRFYHFARLAWRGSGAAFPPPRLPASNPERGSAAPTAPGAQPAPLFRAASHKEEAQRD